MSRACIIARGFPLAPRAVEGPTPPARGLLRLAPGRTNSNSGGPSLPPLAAGRAAAGAGDGRLPRPAATRSGRARPDGRSLPLPGRSGLLACASAGVSAPDSRRVTSGRGRRALGRPFGFRGAVALRSNGSAAAVRAAPPALALVCWRR